MPKDGVEYPDHYSHYYRPGDDELLWRTFCGYENRSDFILCFYDYRGLSIRFTLDECRRLHEDLQAHMNLNEG